MDRESLQKDVSIVIPMYNEEHNIAELYKKTKTVLTDFYPNHELIFIDDGSKDESYDLLKNLAKKDNMVKIIKFRRNYGQTAAMMAGIQLAQAPIIVTMDGDLQNDPTDIPLLVDELKKGYDAVCGWRKKRRDALFRRRIPSIMANKIISFISGLRLHDYGCTLRAYDAEILKSIKLYGEMHRFIPALVFWHGGKCKEVIVKHSARTRGKSKYGIKRVITVVLDLFFIRFMSGYSTHPIRFFGEFSIACYFIAAIISSVTLYQRYITGIEGLKLIPFILLIVLLMVIGTQTILIGILAEIVMRTYYESQNKLPYSVKEIINKEA